jgi:hypothetical protein
LREVAKGAVAFENPEDIKAVEEDLNRDKQIH